MNWKNHAVYILLIIAFSAWPLLMHYFGDIQSWNTGCDGIDYFYTNYSFRHDWYNLTDTIYLNCYDNTEEDPFIPLKLYQPIDVLNCKGKSVDCEDISHMIMCLAKRHNITCKYYTDITIGDYWHQGIRCLENGVWQKYN